MDKRFHNGQGFLYKVSLREAGGTDVHWNSTDVRAPPLVVHNTGTYRPFEIKVQAVNTLGAAPEPESEIGHSGEDSTSPGSTLNQSALRFQMSNRQSAQRKRQMREDKYVTTVVSYILYETLRKWLESVFLTDRMLFPVVFDQ